jgi:hypothetical protein
MLNSIKKDKAIILRKRGFSFKEISEKININKSTVAYWCKEIKLSQKQKDILLQKSKESGIVAGIKLSQKAKKLRDIKNKEYQKLGKEDLGKLSKRDFFILGLGLYWGEGYKKGNYEFGFTNSDPIIIKAMIKFLENFYKVNKDELILRISINHIYKNSENEILKYWSNITKTKLSQFTKTSFIKSRNKKIYSADSIYHGTLRIKIRKGANLKRRILGSINYIQEFI